MIRSSRIGSLSSFAVEHDLFRRPVSTFRDHALRPASYCDRGGGEADPVAQNTEATAANHPTHCSARIRRAARLRLTRVKRRKNMNAGTEFAGIGAPPRARVRATMLATLSSGSERNHRSLMFSSLFRQGRPTADVPPELREPIAIWSGSRVKSVQSCVASLSTDQVSPLRSKALRSRFLPAAALRFCSMTAPSNAGVGSQ